MKVDRLSIREKQRAFRYFQSISARFHFASTMGALRFFRQRENASVVRLAQFESPARSVIDVGCGVGFYSLCAKNAGMYVCAVDVCEGAVEKVRPFVDETHLADIEDLKLDRQFDIVVCAGALESVSNPRLALRNLIGLVAPGGRLVLQVPMAGWVSQLYRMEKRLFGLQVRSFTERWFIRRCRSMGLVLNAIERPLPFGFTIAFTRAVAKTHETRLVGHHVRDEEALAQSVS